MMKKISLIVMILLLAGCSEKQEFEQVVLEQMKLEKDIKDYKIDPETITKCVVQTTSENMPGVFVFDPDRRVAYKNYTKMLLINNSNDPKKTLEELRNDFGSARNLGDAHANYTESLVNCMSGMVSSTEEDSKQAVIEKK